MKNPDPIPAGTSPLDWPYEAGMVNRVLEKVELKVKQRKRRRRRAAAGVAGLLGLILLTSWGVPYVRDTAAVATAPAQRRQLELADGSRVELNARTNLHTDFRHGRRLVRLEQGEAFFSVAKDAAHPFLVRTPAGTVRVTGTRFDVRLAENRQAVVTLLEGAVEIQETAAPVKLAPGQQAVFDRQQTGLRTLSAGELENSVAWRQGRLVLDGLTLAEAAGRFAAYHGVPIEVAPAVAGLHPGGSAPLDNLSGSLAAIQDTLPVRVLPQGGGYRIIPRSPAEPAVK